MNLREANTIYDYSNTTNADNGSIINSPEINKIAIRQIFVKFCEQYYKENKPQAKAYWEEIKKIDSNSIFDLHLMHKNENEQKVFFLILEALLSEKDTKTVVDILSNFHEIDNINSEQVKIFLIYTVNPLINILKEKNRKIESHLINAEDLLIEEEEKKELEKEYYSIRNDLMSIANSLFSLIQKRNFEYPTSQQDRETIMDNETANIFFNSIVKTNIDATEDYPYLREVLPEGNYENQLNIDFRDKITSNYIEQEIESFKEYDEQIIDAYKYLKENCQSELYDKKFSEYLEVLEINGLRTLKMVDFFQYFDINNWTHQLLFSKLTDYLSTSDDDYKILLEEIKKSTINTEGLTILRNLIFLTRRNIHSIRSKNEDDPRLIEISETIFEIVSSMNQDLGYFRVELISLLISTGKVSEKNKEKIQDEFFNHPTLANFCVMLNNFCNNVDEAIKFFNYEHKFERYEFKFEAKVRADRLIKNYKDLLDPISFYEKNQLAIYEILSELSENKNNAPLIYPNIEQYRSLYTICETISNISVSEIFELNEKYKKDGNLIIEKTYFLMYGLLQFADIDENYLQVINKIFNTYLYLKQPKLFRDLIEEENEIDEIDKSWLEIVNSYNQSPEFFSPNDTSFFQQLKIKNIDKLALRYAIKIENLIDEEMPVQFFYKFIYEFRILTKIISTSKIKDDLIFNSVITLYHKFFYRFSEHSNKQFITELKKVDSLYLYAILDTLRYIKNNYSDYIEEEIISDAIEDISFGTEFYLEFSDLNNQDNYYDEDDDDDLYHPEYNENYSLESENYISKEVFNIIDKVTKHYPKSMVDMLKLYIYRIARESHEELTVEKVFEHLKKISFIRNMEEKSKEKDNLLATIGLEIEIPNDVLHEDMVSTIEKLGIPNYKDGYTHEIRAHYSYHCSVQVRMIQELINLNYIPTYKTELEIENKLKNKKEKIYIKKIENETPISLHVNFGLPFDIYNNNFYKYEEYFLIINDIINYAFTSANRIKKRKTFGSKSVRMNSANIGTSEKNKHLSKPLRMEFRATEILDHTTYRMLYDFQRIVSCLFCYIKEKENLITDKRENDLSELFKKFIEDSKYLLNQYTDITDLMNLDREKTSNILVNTKIKDKCRKLIQRYSILASKLIKNQ